MSKRKKLLINSSLVVLAIAPGVIYSYEYGPLPGYTAAPGDNPTGCQASGCHTDTPNSGPGSVKIVASGGTTYVPGQMQQIQVIVADSTMRVYGFQLSARIDSNPTNQEAGLLLAGSDGYTQVICSDDSNSPATGCPASSGGSLQWIEHTLVGYYASKTPPSFTYNFTWTPPSTNVGTITLYVAGNAGSGELIVTNTHTYISKLQLSPSTGGSNPPAISLVANAEGESPTIAPNTWVEIKGSNLAPAGVSDPLCAPGYCWQGSDFVNNQMPTQLSGASATVNGKSAYVYYISPTQVNILTPPDTMPASVQVVVTNGGATSAPYTAPAQALSPSFFVFGGGPYVAATHVNGSYIGPTTLYPGLTTPAKANEIVILYANGFGPTTVPVISGSVTQSGTLSPLPVVKIGGIAATVQFAGLSAVGEFQFNVVVPANAPSGDQSITVAYNGSSTQPGTLITIQ